MHEALRSKKVATLLTVMSLGGGALAGCGGQSTETPTSGGVPKEHVVKDPDSAPAVTAPVKKIDNSTNFCNDEEFNETIKNIVGDDVNCYHVAANKSVHAFINAWILDKYTPDNAPYGSGKATVTLGEDPYNAHNNKDYKFALKQGGRPVRVEDGWSCSYRPETFNLSCYRGEEVAGLNLNGSHEANPSEAYEDYKQIMETVLEAARQQ